MRRFHRQSGRALTWQERTQRDWDRALRREARSRAWRVFHRAAVLVWSLVVVQSLFQVVSRAGRLSVSACWPALTVLLGLSLAHRAVQVVRRTPHAPVALWPLRRGVVTPSSGDSLHT
jgi:hypothetical protein